jgi:XapX domain-containing protein
MEPHAACGSPMPARASTHERGGGKQRMKVYLLSLGAGVLVGVAYSLMGVRSPAPPVVALVGLLGIRLGEQIVPLVKSLAAGRSAVIADGGEKHGSADDPNGSRR